VKRIIITLCVFLLLGAIVNVAVAWGCAAFIKPATEWSWYDREELVGTVGSNMAVFTSKTFGSVSVLSNRYIDPHHDDPEIPNTLSAIPPWAERAFRKSLADSDLVLYGTGWPRSCLWCEYEVNLFGVRASHTYGGVVLSLRPWVYYGSVFEDRRLPLRPIWPGFAINTLFYAAILWLLFAAPGSVRRWRRIRRGLCVKCAYPVGTSEVCTECGTAIRPGGAAECSHG
jgi:hypothetical protein